MVSDTVLWKTISDRVTEIALPILPHISRNKLRSEIISNLFETQAAEVLSNTVSAKTDREPDLVVDGIAKEIKVTYVRTDKIKKTKWMGGKYSKRESDYIFIMWTYQPEQSTLYGIQKERIAYNIIQTYSTESDWKTVDNGKENYYATVFESDKLLTRPHEILRGNHDSKEFILEWTTKTNHADVSIATD